MKTFSPLTLAAVALGLATAIAVPNIAQAAPGAHRGKAKAQGGKRLQKLATEIGLTATQEAKLKPMLMSAGQQAKAIKADTTLTPQAKQAKIKEIRKNTRQGMLAVLTPDQQEKLKAVRQQRRAGRLGKVGKLGKIGAV